MRFLHLFSLFFCLGAGTVLAQNTNVQTQGNLTPTQDVGCIPLANATPDLSAADLQLSVWRCFETGQDNRAAKLFVLMFARATFDSMRVSDETAHQARQMLIFGLEDAGGQRWNRRMDKALAPLEKRNSASHESLCATMSGMAPPSYYPAYMIQHGMDAVLGRSGQEFVKEFKANKAWQEVLSKAIKCA